MMQLYHVLGKKWIKGQPIYSLNEALATGVLSEDDYQWSDFQDLSEYPDADIICFFESLEEAVEWATEIDAKYIAVIDSETIEEQGYSIIENREGYNCTTLGKIDPSMFEVIEV